MNQTYTQPENTEESEMVVAAAVEELQVVVSDVDQFLSCWLDRLSDTVVSHQPLPTTDPQLRKRIKDFQRQQAEWDNQRQCEELEIQRKLDEITQAWLHLEAEQRKLLQAKELQMLGSQESSVSGDAVSAVTRTSPERYESEPIPSADSLSSNVKHSSDTTVQQFQRLRREIESSRPHLGRR
ncbi:hypothetical protein CA13_52750 [Planctomycetes bacterium CA13]|uniref:Uncharacterized protein n=1 Tax=Novipirellula herctigrandis TaxID=2527986 RepID=A0A5C5Z903_9BACT|nr:hypothetical protein CA13_52750 [Planctomycetes bacterium CA13]